MNLKELAEVCNGTVYGDSDFRVAQVESVKCINPNSLVYIASTKVLNENSLSSDVAYIVKPEWKDAICHGIVHDNPTQAFRLILNHLYVFQPSAVIESTVKLNAASSIGQNVSIGHYSVIEEGVVIEDNCVIGSHSIIRRGTHVGAGTHIGSHVSIHHDCVIGQDCMIADAVVIGGQGFGFSFESTGWEAIPQIGSVHIGHRVHIGANSCIDRGAIDDTVIGDNVIIDNLVHIAHNVEVGERSAMAACVGIAGSTRVGKNCLLAGQVGVVGHIAIADGVQVNGGARVLKSIKKPGAYAGSFHAMPVNQWNRIMVYVKKLEQLFKRD